MNKAVWILSLLLPLAAPAQSVITIAPQQCVYRPGDDPTWAAPNLDETGWQPYAQWKLNPDQPRIWVRCHADLRSLQQVASPTIQVSLWAAYQLYIDGVLTGGAGNVRNGNFNMNTVRSFALQPAMLRPGTIALRVTFRFARKLPVSPLPPLELSAGADSVLRGQRAARLLSQSAPDLFPAIGFSLVGVLGVIALVLFVYDPTRRELFLLALSSICSACTFLVYLFASALVAYPSAVYLAAESIASLAAVSARPVFFFALARRGVPLALWTLIALNVLFYVVTGFGAILPPAQALRVDFFSLRYLESPHFLTMMAMYTAPFFAFWPYSRITRRMWPLVGMCLLWGAILVALFAVRATAFGAIPGIPDFNLRWGPAVTETRALVEVCAMVTLFALLFREQRQIALDRAVLAGEMQAASEIQRMLAPANLDCAPGIHIDVAFYPMREVGGDFYLCRVLQDGRQRVLLGDVSGKGSAAAMTAAMLLGGATARQADSPAELLAHLNQVLTESRVAGFATCLCADFAPNGHVTLANAGHLAPYLRGEEIAVPSGLPLGLNSQASEAFQQIEFTLSPKDTLTLISDGVVEARSSTGDLFGFDRTRAISNLRAEHIAREAQMHGQEDDITVLTLTFAPAEVAHA
jgi:hypothetical protein